MSSNKKLPYQQQSILSFFNTACNVTGSKKRTHVEMMNGEDNDKSVHVSMVKKILNFKKAPSTDFNSTNTQKEKEVIKRLQCSEENSQDINGIYVVTKRKKVIGDEVVIEEGFDTPKFKKNVEFYNLEDECGGYSKENKNANSKPCFNNIKNQEDCIEVELQIEADNKKTNLKKNNSNFTNQNNNVSQVKNQKNVNNNVQNVTTQKNPEKIEEINLIKEVNKKRKKMIDDEDDEDFICNVSDSSSVNNSTNKKPTFNNKIKTDNSSLKTESNNNIQAIEAFNNPYTGLPEFLKADKIKDKMGRRPDDPNYDPTTLLVPTTFLKSKDCTPVMQQFWQFKMDNFDKVLFFKLGKFYELFFDDAIIGNQVLDLNWMGNDPRKLHVGFPEKCLEEKASRLIDAGFKICVVEQTERPDEMKERIKGSGLKDKVVKRELCNVFTKGTYLNGGASGLNYQNKFCISLVCNLQSNGSHHLSQGGTQMSASSFKNDTNNLSSEKLESQSSQISGLYNWGFCIFDVTTLKFYIGQLTEEDESFNKITTLLYNVRPEEVIIMRNNLPSYVLNFIQTLSSKPQITYLKNDYSIFILNKICTKYFGEDIDKWQLNILNYVSEEDTHRNACCALYITANFLEKILLAEQCFTIGSFEEYTYSNDNPFTSIKNKNLIIDYQAVTNLELVETKLDPKNIEAGSLLEYVNRCVSGFGKRLMRTWLLNPLGNLYKINERLDMVEDFINNQDLISSFRTALCKWPDIERQCSKIYKFAINNNSRAVYFEDVSKNRLQEFFNLINFLKKSVDIFNLFENRKYKFKSQKLIQKVTLVENDSNGCVPNIKEELEHFSANFTIINKTDENNNAVMFVEPNEGVSEEYDEGKREIAEIKDELDEILKKERKRLKCAVITYAHTKFYRYELEIPEEYVAGDKRPHNYKLTTSKKGYVRFHTDEILKCVNRLEFLDEKIKEETKKFNVVLFKQFYMKSAMLNDFIKNVAELDCLATLAVVSSQSDGNMTRPQFISLEENGGLPYLCLEKSRHPCLSSRCHTFVPNNILIGDDTKTSIVITGPNMGGKSTLLRQTCVSVIMAQIGCYVPAEKCVMTVVDRIFTRIGARDKILEGKSTFFIEMEETKTIMSNATINSLVIIDELGRGTSTHDGTIIAKTILDRLSKRIKCRTLFTTHYHNLKDWCREQPGVGLYFMDCMVNEDSKDITFLYKFKKGICPQSYGIYVSKLAGLPESIIKMAAEVSDNYRKYKSIFAKNSW